MTLAPAAPAVEADERPAEERFGLLEWAYAAVVVQTVLLNPVVADTGGLQIYLNTLTWPLLALASVVRWASGREPEAGPPVTSVLVGAGALTWLVLFYVGFRDASPHAMSNLLRLLYVPVGLVAGFAVFRAADRLLDVAVLALGVKGVLVLVPMVSGPIDILHRLTVPELGGHNSFAAFLTFVVLLRGATWAVGGRRPSLPVLAALGVMTACIVLTFSRGAFVSLVAGLATLTVSALWRTGAAQRSRAAGLLLLAAGVAPVLVAGPLQERLTSVSTGASGRTELWEAAWDGFREEPVTGHGFGSFEVYSPAVVDLAQPGVVGGFTYSVHNLPLQILYEGGLLGFLAVLAVATAVLRRCWHPVVAAAVVAGVVDSIFETFPYVVQVSWVLGLVGAVGLAYRVRRSEVDVDVDTALTGDGPAAGPTPGLPAPTR